MFIVDVFDILRQVDSFPLARCLWLHNQRHLSLAFVYVLLPRCFQFANIGREEPCSRVEVKGFRKEVSQGIQILRQRVLPRESLHAGEVVCSLVGLHTHDALRGQTVVTPEQVKVVNVILLNSHFEVVLDHLPQDGILGEEAIDDELGLAEPN